jgi:glucose-6-phosphate dehydrogenase assembly protein OpcA
LTVNARNALSWQGKDIEVTSVEQHLAELWRHLPVGAGNASAVRTHMFNLIVYAENAAQLSRIARLTQLSERHPSRAIVLYPDRSHVDPSVDAHLSLICKTDSSGAATYCHEQIVLTVHGRAADHLASVVVPLLMPELPTYLWWPGQPPFGYRVFQRLLSTADQLFIDSAGFDSPGDGMAELARLCEDRYGVNDFHWARLTPWREMIAQFFDGSVLLPYLSGIRSVTVEFGAGGGPSTAVASGLLLVIGWLGGRLGWQPETTLDEPVDEDTSISVLQGERLIFIELRFRDYGPQAAQRLMALEIVSQPADRPPGRFGIRRDGGLYHVSVSMQIHGEPEIKRVIPLGIKSDDELLDEELELAGQDRLYKEVISVASRLAGREISMIT